MSDMIGNKNNLFKFQIGNALMPVIIIVAVIVISGITVYFLIFQQHNLKIGALRSTRDNGYFSKIESTKLNLKTSKLATIPTKYEEIGSNTVSSIESIVLEQKLRIL